MRNRSLLTGLLLGVAGIAPAQEAARARTYFCPANNPPDYGFETIDCVNCEITAKGQSWIVFHRPPVIRDVRSAGPAAGKLRNGDTLVAIDGFAITTPQAAARYGNVARGDTIEFRVRRGGETLVFRIVAGDRCAPHAHPLTWTGDSTMRLYWRVRVKSDTAPGAFRLWLNRGDSGKAWAVRPPAWDTLRMASYKLSYSLTPLLKRIAIRGDSTPAEPGWIGIAMFRMLRTPDDLRAQNASAAVFAEPPEIAAVAPGSPADLAGIVAGDTLWAVDGMSVRTAEGTRRFLNAPAGVAIRLTVRRRGASIELRIVPEDPPANPPVTTFGNSRE